MYKCVRERVYFEVEVDTNGRIKELMGVFVDEGEVEDVAGDAVSEELVVEQQDEQDVSGSWKMS